MAAYDVSEVLKTILTGLDEDILTFIVGVVEDMKPEERKSSSALGEVIVPFLVDSSFSESEEHANEVVKKIAIKFGGSGYKSGGNSGSGNSTSNGDDAPLLLSAPVKIIDTVADVIKAKHTYGGAVLSGANSGGITTTLEEASNSQLSAAAIPVTQKQMRKMRKENELTNKILRAEAAARAEAEEEMKRARMAAILASRAAGRQANNGVNIDRFSLPHPSGTGDLLTDAALTLVPGRRYGLVGRNGAGKSTLLRTLANYKLEGLMHLKILMVDQHVEGNDSSAMKWVLSADVERCALLEDEAKLSLHLHDPDLALPPELVGVNLELALAECYERMDAIGVSSAEQRASKILSGLGFSQDAMYKPTNSLSGGWCMRAALAAAIFVSPHLLLLDEPTNHLDLHALVWLENWLTNTYEGIALIVSHDVYFLDEVCTDIIELRSKLAGQSKSTLEHYSGDYKTFEQTVSDRKIAQARARTAYEKEKEKLREFISREGKKYDNPAHQSQRKMKIRQLEVMVEVEAVEEEIESTMHLPSPYGVFDKNEKLLSVKNASFGWPTSDGSPVEELFTKVDFTVQPRARLAIMGKNGIGKTSLLSVLIGDVSPTQGSVSRHIGCRVQMLQQHHYRGEQLDPNLSPLDHIRRLPQEESTAVGLHDPGTRQEETAARGYLSNFGINGGRALLPVKYLSGGQRMKVALAVALFKVNAN